MANFRTHLGWGTVASGLLATLAFAASIVNEQDVLAVAMAGVLGGILPDIDLQKSRPSRIIFFFLGLFFSFCVLFAQTGKLSVLELWIMWLGIFLGVRYVLQLVFHHFAVHRGIFHSVLAAVFFDILTAFIFYYVLGKTAQVSWIAGTFMFVGYMVHLTLDELYSVDFEDNRVKRSFGTALKLYDYGNLRTSLAMTAAGVALFLVSPSINDMVKLAKERPALTLLQNHFLPDGVIFDLDKRFEKVVRVLRPSASQAASRSMEQVDTMPTGSIAPREETHETPQDAEMPAENLQQ